MQDTRVQASQAHENEFSDKHWGDDPSAHHAFNRRRQTVWHQSRPFVATGQHSCWVHHEIFREEHTDRSTEVNPTWRKSSMRATRSEPNIFIALADFGWRRPWQTSIEDARKQQQLSERNAKDSDVHSVLYSQVTHSTVWGSILHDQQPN